jgi:hypothetical protein
MEGIQTPLSTTLQSLEKPPPLGSLREPIEEVEVVLHRVSGEKRITISGIAPFHTIEDLHRILWYRLEMPEDLYPKYSYLAFETGNDDQVAPAMFSYINMSQEGTEPLIIPNPLDIIPEYKLQPSFVDDQGEKLPVNISWKGRTTLEDAFLKPMNGMPTFHIFSLKLLISRYIEGLGINSRTTLTINNRDWYGLFSPYFPSLPVGSKGTFTEEDAKAAKATKTYIEAKLDQLDALEELIASVQFQEIRTTGVRYLSLQWTNTERESMFEGVDALFFSADVNSTRPFMRLLMPNATPMTKLYKPDPLEPPIVNDPVLLKTWATEPNPIPNENILFIKTLLRKQEFGLPPLYGTFRIMDDTTADFTIQPRKDQRILDFRKDLVNLNSILLKASEDFPFNLQDARIGRASLNMEFRFDKVPPKSIRKQIAKRLSYLSTFFQEISFPEEEQRPFLSYRYKCISNFTSEDRIASYLTFILSRKGIQPGQEKQLVPDLVKEFNISEDEALNQIVTYFMKKQEITTPDPESKEFLALYNPGIDISLYSLNINTFIMQLHNIRAVGIEDILRVSTIMSLVFYGNEDDWESVISSEGTSSELIKKAAAQVEHEDIEEEYSTSLVAKEEKNTLFDFDEAEALNVNIQPAVPTPAQEPAPAKKMPEPKKENVGKKLIGYMWFIEQLKKLDPVLYVYSPAKAGEKHYTEQCAANDGRQPAILTEQQYQNMRKIYAKEEAEGKVGFVIYGVPETKRTIEEAVGKAEQITIMRYGSDPTNLFYYLCTRIFCIQDLLPILEADWESTIDYYGKPKQQYSCPFCHGEQITEPKKHIEGKSVLIRKNKPKYTYGHFYINFLKDGRHPNGYELPCCFVSRKDISWDDNRFKRIRDQTQQAVLSPAMEETMVNRAKTAAIKSTELEEAYKGRQQLIVEYDVLRWKAAKEYVVSSEKYPLEPGKFGLLSLELDSFFGQDSSSFVARTAIKQEFKPNTHGFFRLGVLNKLTFLNQSLFAALCPLLGVNTIMGVAEKFTELITPRIFANLNFGNLAMEFYDPSDERFPIPSDSTLSLWVQKHLLIQSMNDTKFEVARLYRSYHRFIHYINDSSQRKQLRHFVHALAEPGLITPQGLTILTLYYTGGHPSTSKNIKVLCPMMGFDIKRYSTNSVGFLTYSDSGIWEPVIYIDKLSDTSTAKSDIYYTLTQQQINSNTFPKVVRERYNTEFLQKCSSPYRGAFTLQSGVDNRALIPASRAIDMLADHTITGIVKDIYNHLVAITLKNQVEGRSDDVLIPVVDDGYVFYDRPGLKMHLGLQSVSLASANDVFINYKNVITPTFFPLSSIYSIESFLAIQKTIGARIMRKIVGFRLGGPETHATILLPCGQERGDSEAIPEQLIEEASMKMITKDDEFEFEYKINHEIIVSNNDSSYEDEDSGSFMIKKQQVDILYEHFRLSFSNWVETMKSTEVRKYIDDLVRYEPWIRKANLPNYEKARRLKVYLTPYLQKWFVMDDQPIDTKNILIKNDCISIKDNESKCSKVCKMDNGECKIHIPEQIQVRSTPRPSSVPAANYFIDRLIDEIVRLPSKKYELMNKGIKRVQIPKTNIYVGSQWIVPINTPAWYDLLRLNIESGKEQPQYYEEFGRREESKEELEELIKETRLYELPEKLANEIPSENKKNLAIRLIGDKTTPRGKSILRYFGSEESGSEEITPATLTEISKRYSTAIIMTSITKDPMDIIGRVDGSKFTPKSSVYILVPDFPEGPGIVVQKESLSDVIPASLLVDETHRKLYDSIQVARVLRRIIKKPTNPPQNLE